MIITAKVPTDVEVTAIRCVAPVRYEEDDIPNDYPHRSGDMWDITIALDTGQIRDWPTGVEPRKLCMKVVDEGSYYLIAADGHEVAKQEQEYVPSLFPGDHYGDYLKFDIDATGRITNWISPSPGELEEEFLDGDDD